MGYIDEFKQFVMRGNLIDMAIGVAIGASFGSVTGTFINKVFMPPVGLISGGVDFKDKFFMLKSAPAGTVVTTLADAEKAKIPVIAYGEFINACINFLLVALVMFIIIKAMNAMKKAEPAPPPPGPTPTEKLLGEIRDALVKR